MKKINIWASILVGLSIIIPIPMIIIEFNSSSIYSGFGTLFFIVFISLPLFIIGIVLFLIGLLIKLFKNKLKNKSR